MNASFGSFGALMTGNPSGANSAAGAGAGVAATAGAKAGHPAQGKGGSPFAGMIGGLRVAAIAGGIAPDGPAAIGAPGGGAGLLAGASAAKVELLSDIVALAMQTQQSFANAQSPQAQAEILADFGNALGQRLAAFNPGLDANALTMAVQNLAAQDLAAIAPQAQQPGPAALARAVLTALSLDDVPAAALGQPASTAAAKSAVTSVAAIESGLRGATRGSLADAAHSGRASLPEGAEASRMVPPNAAPAAGAPMPEVAKAVRMAADGVVKAPPARAPIRGEATDLFSRAPIGGGTPEDAMGGGAATALQSQKPSAAIGALAQQFDAAGFWRPSVDAGEVAPPQLGRALSGGMDASFLRGLETGVLQGKVGAEVPSSPAFARHLAAQVSGTRISEGSTRIELTPRGLGDIEIDMRHDEAGKLRVVLKADNPAVLTAFRQDRELLLGALRESSGGDVVGSDVDLSFESFAGHQSRQQSDQDGWRSAVVGHRTLVTEAPPPVSSFARAGVTQSSGHEGLDIIT
jgi:hypothetical protein